MFIPNRLQESFDMHLHQILENYDFLGLKPVTEFLYLSNEPDSMFARVQFLKERREFKFPVAQIPYECDELAKNVSKAIIGWLNECLYKEQPIPQELK